MLDMIHVKGGQMKSALSCDQGRKRTSVQNVFNGTIIVKAKYKVCSVIL